MPLAFILGAPEIILVLVILLLFFGRRLPEVARSLGKSVNEFKRGMNDVQESIAAPPPVPAAPAAPVAPVPTALSAPPSAPENPPAPPPPPPPPAGAA